MGDNDNHAFCPSRWWEELRGPARKSSRSDSNCFPANPFFLSLPPLKQPPPPWHSGVSPRGAAEGGTTVGTRARSAREASAGSATSSPFQTPAAPHGPTCQACRFLRSKYFVERVSHRLSDMGGEGEMEQPPSDRLAGFSPGSLHTHTHTHTQFCFSD